MTPEQKLKLIRDLIIQNLTFYDAPVNEMKVKMFAAELQDLDLQAIDLTLSDFRKEKGRRLMPMPSDIRDKIRPVSVSDESIAIEATTRIVTAISKYGHTNHEAAKNFIGQLGWEVVKRQGGWNEVCQTDMVGVFQSQSVKIAKSVLEQSRAGMLDHPPELPVSRHAAGPPWRERVGVGPAVAPQDQKRLTEPARGPIPLSDLLGQIKKESQS